MNSQAADPLLARVRKLLAKAEDAGVTAAEAQALTAKAAELMAKYGIDRALLAADQPETDQPADRIVTVENPWGRVKAHLLISQKRPALSLGQPPPPRRRPFEVQHL